MKMICDVPDEVIKSVRDGTWLGSSVLEKMIAYGTPLPKGHGRLIDKDALIGKIHGVKSIVAVSDAKTIIEADKESEEHE